jgi:hypothetical protein
MPTDATTPEPRLRFLAPHAAAPEGLSAIEVDLAAFFVVVAKVGRDEALLLLLIRALRHRTGSFALRMHDLAWMLRARNRRITTWLDRLTREGRVVYQTEEVWDVPIVTVEILPDAAASPYVVHRHTLPTSWFFTLPLLGRKTFTCFLFLLSREAHEGLVRSHDLARAARLRGPLHAAWHLRKLHRHGILVRPPTGGVILRDPPVLTRYQRLRLRFLAHPTLTRALRHIGLLLVILIIGIGLAIVALRTPYRPLP